MIVVYKIKFDNVSERMYHIWTGRNNDPEINDTYQYILDLQNKITETCEFAQQELSKIRNKNQKYVNTNAKLRQLNPQDHVWVLNTKTQSKFDFNWTCYCP